MMTSQRKDILVYDVPDEIREALIADARTKGISINDLAVSILAERFRVRHKPTGAPFQEGDAIKLALRTGPQLHRKVDMERAKRSGTMRGVALETIALHYGITPPPVGRRPRTKGKA